MNNGGIIGVSNNPTSNNATGIWNLNEIQIARLSNSWPSSRIVTTGLVLLLDPNYTASYAGGNTWIDISGNGNNGNIQGNLAFTNTAPRHFTFNGVNNYVTFGLTQPAQNSNTSFTWSIWVSPRRNATGDLFLGSRGATLDFTKLTASGFEYYPLAVNQNAPLNVWQNITVVKTGTNFIYYRNGTQVANGTSAVTRGAIPFFVGGDLVANEFSNARISMVMVYNRALNLSEIQQNFEITRGTYGI